MTLSEPLLKELSTWEISEVPEILFHGCRSDDHRIDIQNQMIGGNKWFSNNIENAEHYPFHITRQHCKGDPYCIEVKCKTSLQAVRRPKEFDDEGIWVIFLERCFPRVTGFELSRYFQDHLLNHLAAINNAAKAYASFDGFEVCLPECEKHIIVKNIVKVIR
jgi:hypothetical protein